MTDIKQTLKAVIDQTLSADLNPIKEFLLGTIYLLSIGSCF